jgi:hypothetical protein
MFDNSRRLTRKVFVELCGRAQTAGPALHHGPRATAAPDSKSTHSSNTFGPVGAEKNQQQIRGTDLRNENTKHTQ